MKINYTENPKSDNVTLANLVPGNVFHFKHDPIKIEWVMQKNRKKFVECLSELGDLEEHNSQKHVILHNE